MDNKTVNHHRSLIGKRLYDVFFSSIGLVLLSPLFLLLSLAIKVSDRGDVFYGQERVGWKGRRFRIYKFRTMVPNADGNGPVVTRRGDPRVTNIGRLLRRLKLDELPQLWNVLKGEMSLVGPRPEVPYYVQKYTPEQLAVLQHKPGITDLASVRFRDEELLLGQAPNVETFYLEHCLPEKLKLNLEYAARSSLLSDTWVILQTICPSWLRTRQIPDSGERTISPFPVK